MSSDVSDNLHAKQERLLSTLRACEHVAVALSGGVDSSYLLAAAVDALGAERVTAFTADSPLLSTRDLANARDIAASLGVAHRIVPFDELAIPEVAENLPRRCYYCKRARFEALLHLTQEIGSGQLLHGENADDHLDYRPGSLAAQQLGVRAPLAEVGLTKAEIRELAHQRGLPNWSAPADACLATRFPPNTHLAPEALRRVRAAEEALQTLLGGGQLRVRDHGTVARIEVLPEQFPQVMETARRERIVAQLRALGYRHITLDLDGYRRGSSNESTASL